MDRRLDLQPEPRLFMRPGRETGASRILVLLDLSESTNDLSVARTIWAALIALLLLGVIQVWAAAGRRTPAEQVSA